MKKAQDQNNKLKEAKTQATEKLKVANQKLKDKTSEVKDQKKQLQEREKELKDATIPKPKTCNKSRSGRPTEKERLLWWIVFEDISEHKASPDWASPSASHPAGWLADGDSQSGKAMF